MIFVALLRAVNVSGQNRVPMADLRVLLEGLGLSDVRTYLQSGNAVFDVGTGAVGGAASGTSHGASAAARTSRDLATAIAARIERDLSARVGVLVMSAGALAEVAGANPFLRSALAGEANADEKWLHATFLFGHTGEADFGEASEAARSAAYEADFSRLTLPVDEGEAAAFVGPPLLEAPVIYIRLPHGYGRTKLNNAWFERRLGATATTRNWRTVQALVEMSAPSP